MKPYQNYLKDSSRQLRKDMTEAEQVIWYRVRRKQIMDVQFYRQKPLLNFIVDFYCAKARLVIELDGSQHLTKEGLAKDKQRTEAIEKHGITLIRFYNNQVMNETESVLEHIYNILNTLIPSPSGREARGEGEIYQDIAGYCKSATLEDIKANDYVLTPGRYVGAAPLEDDGIPFETKMSELSQTLYRQMKESEKLDAVIRKNLEVLGYGE